MRARLHLTLCTSIIACVRPHPDLAAPERADSLRPADSAAVTQVAAQFGIQPVVRIADPFMTIVGCSEVRAVSAITVDGERRSWYELTVRRRGRATPGGQRCRMGDTHREKVVHSGRWVATSAELSQYTRWRVHDGDWFVDVFLGAGVTYDDATLIVRTVRHRTFVDAIPKGLRHFLGDTLPAIDANDILGITKSHHDPGTFEVETSENCLAKSFCWASMFFDLSIVGGQVQVDNFGTVTHD